MTEYFKVLLLSKPNKNYQQTPVPQIGSTGTAFNSHGQTVVEWDRENPVCHNFKTKSVLPSSHLKTISEQAYNNYKLKNESYVKAYLNKLHDVTITSTHPKLYRNEVLATFNFGTKTYKTSIFIGCTFIRPLFTTTDLNNLHFFSCVFDDPQAMNEDMEFDFGNSIFIDTDKDPLYDMKQFM